MKTAYINKHRTGSVDQMSTSALHRSAVSRRGIMMVEVLVAALLIGAAIGILVPGVSAVKRQRLSQRFDIMGLIELNNVAETLKVSSAEPALSEWFLKRYKAATLAVEEVTEPSVVPESSELKAYRLSIRRPLQKGSPDQKISVVVWKSAKETSP
jgi:Tfp pilus assembly protein PilV